MIDSNFDGWEERLRVMAAGMEYPPTPDIAAGVRWRLAGKKRPLIIQPWYANRLVWAAAAFLLATALLLAVPQARAALFEFFQIGSIRIFPAAPTATPSLERSPTAEGTSPQTGEQNAVSSFSVENLYGQTTLDELQSELGPALIKPDYPMGIGAPDQVFLQDQIGPVGILVWLETDSTEKAWAVLYILDLEQGAFGGKFEVSSLKGTMVNGRPAYWVEGRHLLYFFGADGRVEPAIGHLVEGNTLIWTVGEITYRLESVLTLEEAVRMAESMR